MMKALLRLVRVAGCVIGVLVIIWLVIFNVRLYTAVPAVTTYTDVADQLTYTRNQLDAGLGEQMQALFPEGYYFSYVLYGLSWVNVGLQEAEQSSLRQQAIAEAGWAYDKLNREAGRSPFSPELEPPYGIFYLGWKNYLFSGLMLLQAPNYSDKDLTHFRQNSAEIASAINTSENPFLSSYPGQIWPVDTFPAMVSLRVYARLVIFCDIESGVVSAHRDHLSLKKKG